MATDTCGRVSTSAYAELVRMAPCERPAGHAGFCAHLALTDAKAKTHTQETRIKMGARRLGIPVEEYRANVERGLKWCSSPLCRKWQPVGEFGPHLLKGLNTICEESMRTYSRERMRAQRAAS